jgi:hypothetical protein
VPDGEARVLKHFQARMPYGLVVPDVETEKWGKVIRAANIKVE